MAQIRHTKYWIYICGLMLLASTCTYAAHKNAVFYYAAAQRYAAKNLPKRALPMMDEAIKLDPANIEYLKTRGKLANWAGDLDIMCDSYAKVIKLQPNEQKSLLELAKCLSWNNQLSASKKTFKKYLRLYPKDRETWIRYAKAQSWSGDYRGALKTLKLYKHKFGETKDYLATRAYVLAMIGYGTESLSIINLLIHKNPNNYDLQEIKMYAQNAHNQPAEALRTLHLLPKLKPGINIKEVGKYVKTPLRSNVTLGGSYFHDRDDINIISSYLNGQYYLTPNSSLLGGVDYQWLNAPHDDDYDTIDGKRNISVISLWGGARHRFNPYFALEAHAGGIKVPNYSSYFRYLVNADFQRDRQIFVRLQQASDLYAESPRAVSLGIRRRASRMVFSYQPCPQTFINGEASYFHFSDNNHEWYTSLAPKTAVLRTGRFNLDLGIMGVVYSFDKDLNNGYYDPKFYQKYVVTADAYWRQTSDIGYGLSIYAGVEKEKDNGGFEPVEHIGVKGYFGLYKDWQLILGAYASNAMTASSRLGSKRSDYYAYRIIAALTRRF